MATPYATRAEFQTALTEILGDQGMPEFKSLAARILASLDVWGFPYDFTTSSFVQPALGELVTIQAARVHWIAPKDVQTISHGEGEDWKGGVYLVEAVRPDLGEIDVRRVDSGPLIPASPTGELIPVGAHIRLGQGASATQIVPLPTNFKLKLNGLRATFTWDNPSNGNPDELAIEVLYAPYNPDANAGSVEPVEEPIVDTWPYRAEKSEHRLDLPRAGWYKAIIWANRGRWERAANSGWVEYQGPAKPSAIETVVEGSELQLSWKATPDAEDYAKIEIRPRGSVNEGKTYDSSRSATTFLHVFDTDGDFEFRLAGARDIRDRTLLSEWTAWQSLSITTAPVIPGFNAVVDPANPLAFNLSWQLPGVYEDIRIERRAGTADDIEQASVLEPLTLSLESGLQSTTVKASALGYLWIRALNVVGGRAGVPTAWRKLEVKPPSAPADFLWEIGGFYGAFTWTPTSGHIEIKIWRASEQGGATTLVKHFYEPADLGRLQFNFDEPGWYYVQHARWLSGVASAAQAGQWKESWYPAPVEDLQVAAERQQVTVSFTLPEAPRPGEVIKIRRVRTETLGGAPTTLDTLEIREEELAGKVAGDTLSRTFDARPGWIFCGATRSIRETYHSPEVALDNTNDGYISVPQPGAPQNFAASLAIGEGGPKVTIQWDHPEDPPFQYVLAYTPQGAALEENLYFNYRPAETEASFQLTGWASSYSFRLFALRGEYWSDPSALQTVQFTLAAPENLQVNVDGDRAVLAWTPSADPNDELYVRYWLSTEMVNAAQYQKFDRAASGGAVTLTRVGTYVFQVGSHLSGYGTEWQEVTASAALVAPPIATSLAYADGLLRWGSAPSADGAALREVVIEKDGQPLDATTPGATSYDPANAGDAPSAGETYRVGYRDIHGNAGPWREVVIPALP